MRRPPGRSRLIGLLARARSLLRGLLHRSEIEADMREEFRHHIELRTDDLVRDGLPRHEAVRRAHLEFGHESAHREKARRARGLRLVDQLRFSWIDVRLGLRMLVKHPWLTCVAAFALAVGIPVGMAPSHVADAIEAPLPEDPTDRVRAIRAWDPATSNAASALAADYRHWAGELSSFASLAAFRTLSAQVGERGRAAAVPAATVTASAFDILGRAPLLGRRLVAADEQPGAPRVVVLGVELWRSRFGSDPDVVGRTIRVMGEPHEVVGIMPEGFLFPTEQQLWLPLRTDELEARLEVPVGIFGRLAEGASADEAHAEVVATGLAPLTEATDGRARLRPEVVPFGMLSVGIPRAGLRSVPGFFFFQAAALALLLVACGNVAMLVFARTATRFRELAVRTALGASRARIVVQIFAETLVLALLSAGIGVLGIDWLIGRVNFAALAGEARLPYWLDLGLTPRASVRALFLAVASATVAGVVPALRLTGRQIRATIEGGGSGGSGIRFGRVTGGLIVADVAISVAVVTGAFALAARMTDRPGAVELAGIPAEEYLAVELRLPIGALDEGGGMDRERFEERLGALQRRVVERLESEPGVRAVAVADALPRMEHPVRSVQLEGDGPDEERRWVRTARVDVGFLRALGAPVLLGRDFGDADLETNDAVIVNTVFAERFLGGGAAVGRRVRVFARGAAEDPPWREIVGVVGHLGTNMVNPQGGPAVYLPAAPGRIHPLQLGVHAAIPTESLAPRLRALISEIDPDLVVADPVQLSRVYQGDWYLTMALAGGLLVLVVVLVTLAASGIYAIVSFAVSERTREIGIRGALGAPRRALVMTILRRSFRQIAIGALIGTGLAASLFFDLGEGTGWVAPVRGLLTSLGFALAIVAAVGLCSCLVPARRILRIETSEALRAEG